MSSKPIKLVLTSARLFTDDVAELKRIANAKRSKWQTELRHLVHKALVDARRLGAGGIIR